jgi:glycosyltransferase involved in cell wall biosynthesis
VNEIAEPILSILVPTYNYAAYIRSAIESVLGQRVDGVEVVVADDGSDDATEEVLRPLIEAGAIRYVRQENSGPAAARNLAMANARGRYLMFLDADDALMPGCISATIDFLERNSEVGLFFTNYDIYDETGVLSESGVDIWKVFRGIPHREVAPDEWTFSESLAPYIIRHGAFMHTSGLTLRREVAEKAGPFREGYFYAEDDEFYARVAYVTTAGYLDRVLSRKRNHATSLIHDDANALRNSRHLLELTEIQLIYYGGDPIVRRIVERKVKRCAEGHIWSLIRHRRLAEARTYLRKYLPRYPLHAPFYKLAVKCALPGKP